MPYLILRRREIIRPWNEVTTTVFSDQLRFICKLDLALACIVVAAGIVAVSVPIARFYMTGLTFIGHCFWTGGIVSGWIRNLMIKLIYEYRADYTLCC